jgi:hypothetical protein
VLPALEPAATTWMTVAVGTIALRWPRADWAAAWEV